MKPTKQTPGTVARAEGHNGKADNNVVLFTPKPSPRLGAATARSYLWFENASEIRAAVAEHAAAMNEPVPDKIFVVTDEVDCAYLRKVSEFLINTRFQQHREPFAVVTADGTGCVIQIPVEE
jgi:hypothetical protein